VEVTRVVSSDGGVIDDGSAHIIIIHTPGHTPGDITPMIVVDGKTLLFANDVHGPFRRDWGSEVSTWRRSMERLIAIGPDLLLEGHYGVIRPKGAAIDFIRDMLDQDMQAL
jgi:glyoxylase-like metal-dependent hydrolase (beta-lactamase superfamily II)